MKLWSLISIIIGMMGLIRKNGDVANEYLLAWIQTTWVCLNYMETKSRLIVDNHISYQSNSTAILKINLDLFHFPTSPNERMGQLDLEKPKKSPLDLQPFRCLQSWCLKPLWSWKCRAKSHCVFSVKRPIINRCGWNIKKATSRYFRGLGKISALLNVC